MRNAKRAVLVLAILASTVGVGVTVSPPSASALSAFGWLDTADPNQDLTIRVTGWAATPDCPHCSLGVRIRVDNVLTVPNYRLAYNPRPDLNLGAGYGINHGFDFIIPTNSGTRQYCLDANSYGKWFTIRCVTRTVNAVAGDFARFWGGGWPLNPDVPPSTTLPISWFRNLILPYYAEIGTGITSWNGTARLALTETTNFSAARVRTVVASYGSTYACCWGVTVVPPWSGAIVMTGVTYGVAEIRLNMDTMQGLSPAQRAAVVAHEFGHALGLYHPPNAGVPTIMAGQWWNLAGPQTFDRNSFWMLYP